MNVEVFPVHDKGALIDVPIPLHGTFVHCAFFVRNSSMRLVRIFGDKSSQWRKVPADVMRDARERAQAALNELEPATDRMTSFNFTVDVATAQAARNGA